MPARPKTTDTRIIRATRKLLELHGRDNLSMNLVAAAVGVRTPSLYGRFSDRAALLAEVELELLRELGETLAKAGAPGRPVATLMAQAQAYRVFAKDNPRGYALLFDADSKHSEAGTRARAQALAPTLTALTALIGEHKALLAARVLAPYLHGFVAMELSAAFRLGGGLDAAFENGVSTILRGLVKSQESPTPRKGATRSARRRA